MFALMSFVLGTTSVYASLSGSEVHVATAAMNCPLPLIRGHDDVSLRLENPWLFWVSGLYSIPSSMRPMVGDTPLMKR